MKNTHSRKASNVCTFPLGDANGNKRVWIQKRKLEDIQLNKGTIINIDFSKQYKRITVKRDPSGNRIISGRPDGTPIIDIKNKQVAETLGENVEKITVKFFHDQIIISVSANEQRKAERRAKTSNKACEVFCGGATLSTFAEMAGFKLDTVIDREDKYLDVFDKNIKARTICADVHDVDMNDLPTDCSHLQFSYPCTTYSNSNVKLAKQKKAPNAEAIAEMKEADYLVLALLDIVKTINPKILLMSTPFHILSYALEKLDYKISVQQITGSFTNRKRVAIVAIADDEPVDLSNIQYQTPRTIESHLKTPIGLRKFSHIDDRPRESGARRKGLGIRSHLPSETKINTITRHWTRHSHVSLEHPTKEDYYSDFTIPEIQSLHGLPDSFNPGETKTTARAVLGQGVCDGFKYVLDRIYYRVCVKPLINSLSKETSADTIQLAFAWQ